MPVIEAQQLSKRFLLRHNASIELKVRVLNLSTKALLTVDNHSVLNPGADCELILPVRLGVGETVEVALVLLAAPAFSPPVVAGPLDAGLRLITTDSTLNSFFTPSMMKFSR